MKRRNFLMLASAALVTGCGFKLRRLEGIPFSRLQMDAPAGSAVGEVIRKSLVSIGTAQLVNTAAQAEAVLKIAPEVTTKTILSLSGAGRVTEYRLLYRVSYSVFTPEGQPWVEPEMIELTRDLTYSDAAYLAKSAEETLLFNDMQYQAAQQILRRLRSLKPQPAPVAPAKLNP